MSVFHNLFTSNFQKQTEEIKKQHCIEDNKFYQIYMTTLISTFKWGGEHFPKKLPKFMIEQAFQMGGMIGAYIDGGNLEIYPCFPSGSLTPENTYTKYTVVKFNGETKDKNADEIVVGYNNSFMAPYSALVKNFAEKSSYALRAVDVAIRRATRGKIIQGVCEENLKTFGSMLGDDNTLKEFTVVPHTDDLTDDKINAVSLFDNREIDVLAIWDIYVRYRNSFYATFGVNNVEIQKRERITEAEGSGNDEIVRYTLLDDMYQRRLDFVEEIKNRFDKIITVEVQRDGNTVYALNQSNEDKIDDIVIAQTRGANISQPIEDQEEPNEPNEGVE